MSHVYSEEFFDYIDNGARSSAQRLIGLLQGWVKPGSVVDFGCGRGVWLDEWKKAGVKDICGLDGDYVDQSSLVIPRENFCAVDLKKPQDLGRRFDLAQSLEVGEHLPDSSASSLVEGLARHSNLILFSAAVEGQGGEFHINEQPLRYWQKHFEKLGYTAFDCIRPRIANDPAIEPWYRYNAVLYANSLGQAVLPDEVLSSKVVRDIEDNGDFYWNMRKNVVRLLPKKVVTAIARGRASVIARRLQSK